MVIFLDESGFMLQPVLRRSWSPRGQTPHISQSQKHTRRSCISAIRVSPKRKKLELFFATHSHNVKARDLLRFLESLRRDIRGPVALVWDRWSVHKAKILGKFFRQQAHRIQIVELPSYSPELNPVEFLWSYSKYSDLANLACRNSTHLDYHVRASLKRVGCKQTLLRSFFHKADLAL